MYFNVYLCGITEDIMIEHTSSCTFLSTVRQKMHSHKYNLTNALAI